MMEMETQRMENEIKTYVSIVYTSKHPTPPYLIHVRVLSLDVACSRYDSLDSPHPKVVVVLGTELLRGQLEGGHYLLGENFGVREPKGEKHDLCNHGVVRDHHGHRPEQGLEVVRELCPSSIARVHGDEHCTGSLQSYLHPFKHEPVHLHVHISKVNPSTALPLATLLPSALYLHNLPLHPLPILANRCMSSPNNAFIL